MISWSQRAPFNDWWYWGEQVAKRFRTISELYKENGETQRAEEMSGWVKRLRENFIPAVTAMRKGTKTDEQKNEVKKLEEEAIFHASVMLREVLANFPFVSSAIQDFLYCSWKDFSWAEPPPEIDPETGRPIENRNRTKKKGGKDDARLIELFCGPKGREDEGIRSGKVEDGGLPGILYNLLLAERSHSSRAPTDYGKTMQISAVQQNIATTKNDANSFLNFKPSGGI